jgi:adenine phosphoribosyltransferase
MNTAEREAWLRSRVRDVPDFPQPGILFRDVTPLLTDGEGLRRAIDALEEQVRPMQPDLLVPIESRGFLFAAPLALRLGVGLALVRKPGKLPAEVLKADYALEYGTGTLEMHVDGVRPGQRVVVIDDVIATGGTAAAAAELSRRAGGEVCGAAFFIELAFLAGRQKLPGVPCAAVITY